MLKVVNIDRAYSIMEEGAYNKNKWGNWYNKSV